MEKMGFASEMTLQYLPYLIRYSPLHDCSRASVNAAHNLLESRDQILWLIG